MKSYPSTCCVRRTSQASTPPGRADLSRLSPSTSATPRTTWLRSLLGSRRVENCVTSSYKKGNSYSRNSEHPRLPRCFEKAKPLFRIKAKHAARGARAAAVPARRGESVAPLLAAVERGNLDLVELLISRGADVRVPDRQGRTPMARAAAAAAESPQHAAVLKVLRRRVGN